MASCSETVSSKLLPSLHESSSYSPSVLLHLPLVPIAMDRWSCQTVTSQTILVVMWRTLMIVCHFVCARADPGGFLHASSGGAHPPTKSFLLPQRSSPDPTPTALAL